MKYFACLFIGLISTLFGYQEETLFENDYVGVYQWKLLPGESVGKHQDQNPYIVIALEGGAVTRIGEDGSRQEIVLPKGKSIFQEADRETHDAYNFTNAPIEAIMIELKR